MYLRKTLQNTLNMRVIDNHQRLSKSTARCRRPLFYGGARACADGFFELKSSTAGVRAAGEALSLPFPIRATSAAGLPGDRAINSGWSGKRCDAQRGHARALCGKGRFNVSTLAEIRAWFRAVQRDMVQWRTADRGKTSRSCSPDADGMLN